MPKIRGAEGIAADARGASRAPAQGFPGRCRQVQRPGPPEMHRGHKELMAPRGILRGTLLEGMPGVGE